MRNKPHISTRMMPILMAANSFMNQSSLFGRGAAGSVGSDNLADQKHAKLWQDFGYPTTVEFYMHWNMWRRNGLARRGAKLPVDICWRSHPCVKSESSEAYEEQFKEFADNVGLWQNMRDGDLCQRIGRYGALLTTVADGNPRHKPLENFNSSAVVRIQPLFEDQLTPAQINNDKQSARFGLPETYSLQTGNVGNRNETIQDGGEIHHSRVIILSEDAMGDDIYGIPCNEAGFNALLNWQKVQGSGGEGFWRQAAQRFVLQATGGSEGQDYSPEELTDLGNMVAKMFAGFDAIPSVGNYEMKGLNTGTMPDPDGFRQMALEEYTASIGAPSKMVVGTQTGVKAAEEDSNHYYGEMESRRNGPINSWIFRLIDWLDRHTEIKKPADVKIEWDDLLAPDATKRLELADKMASTNEKLVKSGMKPIYTGNEMREQAGYEEDKSLGDGNDDLETIDVKDE